MLNAIPTLPGKHLAQALMALLLAFASAWAAAIPASYQFYGVGDRLNDPDSGFATDPFTEVYNDRVLSVASALNNNGFIIGFWLSSDETFMTHSLLFGTNPKGVVRFTENFIGVSGSDVPCFNFLGIQLCSNPEFPYGTRILIPEDPAQAPAVVSAFLNTPFDAVAVPASLPFMRYPGNFVDENAQGILATTQLSTTAQYGVIVRGANSISVHVPWLVAINDLEEPLIIAYDGSDGGCLVYGEGCLPELTPCELDANPGNAGGESGREASGHAWGHNKCKDGIVDGNNGGGGTGTGTGGGGAGGGGGTGDGNGALLLHFKDDNSVVRYRFPDTVPFGADFGAATHLFPLAINSTRIVLRGDVTVGSTVYEKRLLSCAFNTVPDINDVIVYDLDEDQVVDCIGGLQLVGGNNSIRVGTVLGFTLNDDDLLVGNLGYNASGVGMPMLVNLATVVPSAELVGNLAAGTAGWEINTITDMNRAGMMSGYGYKDCGRTPEAFYLAPLTSEPQAGVRFVRGAFEHPAYLAPGATLQITPTMTGGSGAYELRVHVKKPGDAEWALLSDWATSAGSWNPGTYQGEVCFKIEARDPSATEAEDQQIVVRYSVGESTPVDGTPDDDSGTGVLTPTQGDFAIGDLLAGGVGTMTLLLLAVGGLVRRRTRREH